MKAVLLAGGLGTRLRPLTYTRPKHLLPVANKPHIDHVLDHLAFHGIDDIVLTTSHLAEAFGDVVGRARSRGLQMSLTHEAEPLGTAGGLKHAERVLEDGTFLVFNADVLTTADLGDLLTFHEDNSAEATILLTPVDDPSRYGVVPTYDDGRVRGFIEKPPPGEAPTNYINAGVYVMEPSILKRVPGGRVASIERELFPGMVQAEARLYAHPTDAYWIDIGTPESYLRANLDALERSTGGSPALGEGANVAADARVSSSSIGAFSQIEAAAVVDRSVLLPGVVVGERAVVRGSILGEGVRVGPASTVVDSTVADGEQRGFEDKGAG